MAAFSMFSKRFLPYYAAMGLGLVVLKFGSFVQDYRDEQLTDFRNKSKLYGGRCVCDETKGW